MSDLSDTRGLIEVFEYLFPEDLLYTCQLVSKHWKDIVRKDEIWDSHNTKNPWFTLHCILDPGQTPAIERYKLNVLLQRNPRCLFSHWANSNSLYSVDLDKSVPLSLPFSCTNDSAYLYAPNDCLIVIGCGPDFKAVFQVDLNTLGVTSLGRMNSGRQSHAAVFWETGIMVTGGLGETSCEFCNKEKWLPVTNLNQVRAKHSSCAIRGKVYVLGGTSNTIEVYQNSAWTVLSSSLPLSVLLPSLRVSGNAILIIGGVYEDASKRCLLRKHILEFSLETLTVAVTSTVLYLVSLNSLSRQGDAITCLDYHGCVKKWKRPLKSTVWIPHSNVLSLFSIQQLAITVSFSVGNEAPVVEDSQVEGEYQDEFD